MNTINSETIKAEVREKLKIFFESNKVDDSLFYTVFKHCMQKFKLDIYENADAVLEVKNKEVILPTDFKQLICAFACHSYEHTEIIPEYTIATTTCEVQVCKNESQEVTNIYQKLSSGTINWTQFDLLGLTKETLNRCTPDCLNFRSSSKNKIDIRNGKMYTSFEEGLVYIEYKSNLEKNGEFEFPDNATIIEWIKAELIHEIFQTLYYNGETDIERRYRDSKNDVAIKYTNAFQIINRSEYQDFYNVANKFIKRYKKSSNLINHIQW